MAIPKCQYVVTIRETREYIHMRIEAKQDNAPRYNIRRLSVRKTDPSWGSALGGFIAGFAGWKVE